MRRRTFTEEQLHTTLLRREVKRRSDRLMNYFLLTYFVGGLIFATFYDTWLVAVGVGGLSLIAYYSVKLLLPASSLSEYVLSTVLGIFMAQYIYQMHGLFEMHFFAFIGSATLITYQNWKLQIPLTMVVIVHHSLFGYLQNSGLDQIYFTQLDYFTLQTFIIHIITATIIFFICGLWGYQLKKYSERQILQTMEMGRLQKEAMVSEEKQKYTTILEKWIQELRDTNRQLEKARQEAEEANQAKTAFLAAMSHEIRTSANGESLLNVINGILDFSKIQSGNIELKKEDFDLRICIEDALSMFRTQAAQMGLNVGYKIDGNVPQQIVGDHLRLRQVLSNLIENALKFTQKGEIFIGAHLASSSGVSNQVQLEFQVRDTGIGIPPEKLDHLFKPFSLVGLPAAHKYAGACLGLSISEKLVKLMGGDIRVDSQPGIGSTFYFTIQTASGTKMLSSDSGYDLADQQADRILFADKKRAI